MDWNLVITRNHALLVRILAELFAMLRGNAGAFPLYRFAGEATSQSEAVSVGQPDAGAAKADATFTIPRHLYAAIMLILRPCESAIRRLIIIAARGLELKPRASQPIPFGTFSFSNASVVRAPRFQLIDPLKHFDPDLWDQNQDHAGSMQPIEPFNAALAYQQAQLVDAPVNAALLLNRLRAMRLALSDLPRQARRLTRWQARQNLAFKANTPYRPMRMSPFRPGPPPGYRRRDIHQVDSVLKDVHYFAKEACRKDTS